MAPITNTTVFNVCPVLVYCQMLKRNRRKEFQSGGTCILGTLSPGPDPWDVAKYPSANPYRPNQLTYHQLLKTHYNRKNHKKVSENHIIDYSL